MRSARGARPAGRSTRPSRPKLIGIAGLDVAPVSLSLNSSFTYLGFALGAALGSLIVAYSSVANIGAIGGLCELAALLVTLAADRHARRAATRKHVAIQSAASRAERSTQP
ncbi:hypothetical protein [Burkholderia glumae]|uniref:hypothetical protein n=1 Tax=Burkholderia glumae TaxID=337 RepID=UPI00214F9456|nr:hypothetical protein [Burkholderia glumae]